MALGEFTRQLAKEALGEQMKNVVDSLRPAELSSIGDSLADAKHAPAPAQSNLASLIVNEVQAMQKALKETDELVVLCAGPGGAVIRVLDFYVPSPELIVVTGIDADKSVTRVIAPVHSLQLLCKPMTAQAGAKPVRIRFITPKSKSE